MNEINAQASNKTLRLHRSHDVSSSKIHMQLRTCSGSLQPVRARPWPYSRVTAATCYASSTFRLTLHPIHKYKLNT